MGWLVPAVTWTAAIELFLGDDASLSAPEIADRLSLPRTTVHELLATPVVTGLLSPAPEQTNRYRLCVMVFQLGSRYPATLELAREGQTVAREIAARCGETVHVAVLEDRDVFYVAKVDSVHAVRMVSAVVADCLPTARRSARCCSPDSTLPTSTFCTPRTTPFRCSHPAASVTPRSCVVSPSVSVMRVSHLRRVSHPWACAASLVRCSTTAAGPWPP